ncbi:SPOR domain-containing protein [Psychromonas sp. SR45-3]|uniref:SPOR domain-containing protein n=1 Tax=Psychromonas sp. SR45-3 TaxID=2760930 RepID=UPI0015F823CB|nr:SPOR domain-containing protein [Psychromonas sp. SR45-3]MBB1272064.1 SPOR domain-containing protein [Psychromonas sp. SR45-3]
MATQFKNRLVGVTILVALVVIFLPSLIDGKKTSYQQEFVATPIKPELKPHTKTFADPASINDPKLVVDPIKVSQSIKTVDQKISLPVKENTKNAEWKVEEIAAVEETKAKQTAAPTQHSNAVSSYEKVNFTDPAWTIQLGAFENKANINALLKKLNKAGFRAHTIPKVVMDGQLTRVFVGPDVSKEKLEGQLPRLKNLTSLNGKLVPFTPIEP